MKLSKLAKIGLTTALAISSTAVLLVQPNKSIAAPSDVCNVVSTDASLHSGDSLQPGDCVASSNALAGNPGYYLVLQTDGNLVVYSYPNEQVIWASGTNGQTVTDCVMQDDGNLVIYGPSGSLWASGTSGRPGSQLTVQDDGNTVIYQPVPVWATNTTVQ